jgi:hypothetical protein
VQSGLLLQYCDAGTDPFLLSLMLFLAPIVITRKLVSGLKLGPSVASDELHIKHMVINTTYNELCIIKIDCYTTCHTYIIFHYLKNDLNDCMFSANSK